MLVQVACAPGRRAETPTGPHFSVLTYNINRERTDRRATLGLIVEADADVAVLEEVTPEWEEAIRAATGLHYEYMEFRHFDRGGGLAILSRLAFDEVRYVPSPAGKYPGWRVSLHTAMGVVSLLAVHLHPPVDNRFKFTIGAWFARPRDRRDEIQAFMRDGGSTDRAIVAGDFNEETNGLAVRWLRGLGYVDAASELGRERWTWSSGGGPFAWRSRLDHILYSGDLRCFSAEVLPGGGSDHRAVIAWFGPTGDAARPEP